MIQSFSGSLDPGSTTGHSFVVGPFPRGTRLRRFVWHVGVGGAAWAPLGSVAGVAVALFPLTSRGARSGVTAASIGGREHAFGRTTIDDANAIAGAVGAPAFVFIPGNMPVTQFVDAVVGEDGASAYQVYVRPNIGEQANTVILYNLSVEVDLPRTVNAVELASPPAPVVKDEG